MITVVRKKKLCKDMNIKRHLYSIQSTFEIFRNVGVFTNKIPKLQMFPIFIGIKRHVFMKSKNPELLGQTVQMLWTLVIQCLTSLRVLQKSFLNLMHCCCSSPQDLWVWNFSQQLTILSEVIDTRDACQDSKRGLWKGLWIQGTWQLCYHREPHYTRTTVVCSWVYLVALLLCIASFSLVASAC
jgi:hypothetical protein